MSLYLILLLSEKVYFTAKICNMLMISMDLSCMQMYAQAYLEPSQTSMVELLCKNHKKALLQMFDWVLNTPLEQVLQQKRLTECKYLSDMVKLDFNILSLPSCFDKTCWFNSFKTLVSIIKNSQLICSANEWTSSYVLGTSTMNELTKKV